MKLASDKLNIINAILSIAILLGMVAYGWELYYLELPTMFEVSHLDGYVYQHGLASDHIILQGIMAGGPIFFILYTLFMVGLLYGILNTYPVPNKKRHLNSVLGFIVLMLLGIQYTCIASSFWIAHGIVWVVMYILCVQPHISRFGTFAIAGVLGISTLIYEGNIVFVLLLIGYGLQQRHVLSYIVISIAGIFAPWYVLWSYIWIVQDMIMPFPYIFREGSAHLNMFGHGYWSVMLIVLSIIGLLYLLVRHLTVVDVIKKQSTLLITYYIGLLIIFAVEPNDGIALTALIPGLSLLLNRK